MSALKSNAKNPQRQTLKAKFQPPNPRLLIHAVRLGLALGAGLSALPAHALICPVTSLQNVSGAETLSTDCEVQSGGELAVSNTGALTNEAALSNLVGGKVSNAGTLSNSDSLSNYGTLANQSGGVLNNNYVLLNESGASLSNAGTLNNTDRLHNRATLTNDSSAILNNSGELSNLLGATLSNAGTLNNTNDLDNRGTLTNMTGAVLDNSSNLHNDFSGILNNAGTLSNSNQLTNNGTLTNELGAVLSNTGTVSNFGSLNNNGSVTNAGQFKVLGGGTVDGLGNFTQTAGKTAVDGSMDQTRIDIQGGTLSGTGDITAKNGLSIEPVATISPGSPLGVLSVFGDLILEGILAAEFKGFAEDGDSDILDVYGMVTFGDDSLVALDLTGLSNPTDGMSWDFLFSDQPFVNLSGLEFSILGLAPGFSFSVNDKSVDGRFGLELSLNAVPEPDSLALIGFGAAALAFARKRRVASTA